eukprot:73506-Chlamydomonas_euryale.AAC.9
MHTLLPLAHRVSNLSATRKARGTHTRSSSRSTPRCPPQGRERRPVFGRIGGGAPRQRRPATMAGSAGKWDASSLGKYYDAFHKFGADWAQVSGSFAPPATPARGAGVSPVAQLRGSEVYALEAKPTRTGGGPMATVGPAPLPPPACTEHAALCDIISVSAAAGGISIGSQCGRVRGAVPAAYDVPRPAALGRAIRRLRRD